MPIKIRTDKRRLILHPSTVAFVFDDKDNPNYPEGMRLFWHQFSLATDHCHGRWQYSIPDACEALGLAVEDVRQRLGIPARYRGEGGNVRVEG